VGLLTGTHTNITAVKAKNGKGERGEENMHMKTNGKKILHTKILLNEKNHAFVVGSYNIHILLLKF